MKKRNLFLMAIAALAFTACSSDDMIDEGGIGGRPINPNGESWVSLSIVARTTGTRALNSPNRENATVQETNMNSVRAIFFDTDNLVTKDYTLAGAEQGPAGTAGEAFKIPSSSTTVLIIVNPSITLPATYTEGTPLATVNSAVNETLSNVADPSGSGNFMMTNARGELETITLYDTKLAAESNSTALYVDRVVAKVRVYVNSTSDNTNVTVEDPAWVLNVTNKRYFPMSTRRMTAVKTATPFDLYGYGSYRIDPNFDNSMNAYTEGGDDIQNANYIANYNYYPSSATLTPTTWNATTNTTSDIEYCLENTQNEAGNYHAYTTQVLLRAKFYPTLFYVPSDAPGTPSASNPDPDNDWIAIGTNGYYTTETIVQWIQLELANKYYHTTPSEFLTPITTAYNNFIAGIGQTPVGIELTPDVGFLTPAEAEAKAAEIVAGFNDDALKTAIKTNGAAKVGNVSYYTAGISYYKIMIKHDDSDDAAFVNALGEFGVVRNSIYDVHIAKFNNPGYPVIPEPTPGTPDETNEGWLSVTININPWTWYTQTENL